jgi:hypothetical protein
MTKVGVDDILAAGASASDLAALPRVEFWPELAPEALHGLAGRIVETIDHYTEAAPVATLAHVLVAVGSLIGSGPHMRVAHDRHPLRLNAALVGQTGKGRKGTAWSTPRYMLGQVDPAWMQNRIKTGLSTGEGLINSVRDARSELQPIKNKGRVVGYETVTVDAGEEDKRLLVVEPELATVLKRMGGEGNTLSGLIREAWDSGELSTLTKNSPLRATGAHVSIIGHITEEELRRYLTETERANGFANRFLWFLVRREKVLPEGEPVPDAQLVPLVESLRRAVERARTLGELQRDPETKALWAAIYPQLSEGEPGLIGAVVSRGESQVLRLSALYAVLDGSSLVKALHLQAALAVWDYAEASARRIFGGRLGDPVADVILAALTARGPMTRTELHGLFGRHRPADEIGAALARLEARGRIRPDVRETAGRSAEMWEAVQ